MLVFVDTVAALLSIGDPTATSLVVVVELALTSAGEAARSLETWSCSLASWSFCQLRTASMSGWTGELHSGCWDPPLLPAGGVCWTKEAEGGSTVAGD